MSTNTFAAPINAAFQMQRTAIKQGTQAIKQGVKYQQQANRTMLRGLRSQESTQQQSVALTREAYHSYLDALESATSGGRGNFRQLHDQIDEQFDTLEEAHAEFYEGLEEQWDRSVETYDEAAEQYLEALDDQTEAVVETQRQTEAETEEFVREVQAEFDRLTESVGDQSADGQVQLFEQFLQFQGLLLGQVREGTESATRLTIEGVDTAEDIAEESAEAAAQDLEGIEGLGDTYADRLRENGIESAASLAEANAQMIAETAEVSEERAQEWIDAIDRT